MIRELLGMPPNYLTRKDKSGRYWYQYASRPSFTGNCRYEYWLLNRFGWIHKDKSGAVVRLLCTNVNEGEFF